MNLTTMHKILPLVLSISAVACADVVDSGSAEADVRGTKQLLCASAADELVYYGDESQIVLEANVSRDGRLADASLTMPSKSNLGVRGETWTAQAKYTPRNPAYEGMQKYSSADAWCGYSVIAPPNLNGQTGTFTVYVQQSCEGGFLSTADLSCKVVTKKAQPAESESAPATVRLGFSGNRKAEAISSGYWEAAQFTGDVVLVTSPETSIDIMEVLPEDDEGRPDTVCFEGDATSAKKIVWAMLGNTDGNGDHWLDEGARITARSAPGALHVEFSVTGEGGSEPYELDVPACK